jgi:hypothetical protein
MELKKYSKNDIIKDFHKLQNTDYRFTSPLSLIGSKTVDFFTFGERLKTKGSHGISFIDFLENIDKYNQKDYYIKFLEKNSRKNKSLLYNRYALFRVYFGSVNIFKPLNAVMVYKQFQPKTVLDFTMGWGGRLVGACSQNINYIGIDNNMNLKKPYQDMVEFLKTYSTSNIQLFFEDCLNIDYSTLDYDMVLTSPPYYNTEIYGDNTPYKTKEEWNQLFYIPIIKMTYESLKIGGYYCLNVPIPIYENICVDLLGECSQKIPLPIVRRKLDSKYKEFIYVWKKDTP